VWQLARFELTRLFATKHGLLALGAFSMAWFIIQSYVIAQAVPFLNSPEFTAIIQQLAGNIGLRELVTWPEAELAIFWIIALYSFPIFSLFVSADQTVGDRLRGTLRFISLRCTREEILLGRFLGQLLIIVILITLTVLTTSILMLYRDVSLWVSGSLLSVLLITQLTIVVMPFIALMSILNLMTNSSRMSIVLAILFFTFGNAFISYISGYLPFMSWLLYMYPGVQILDIASQNSFSINDWLLPIAQTVGLLTLSILTFKRRSL
jgi:ABC-type transport system involved in multi-copper enzyme maturation permease subunit